jgi:hypothetical protein
MNPQSLRMCAGPHGEQAPELVRRPLQFSEGEQQRYGDLDSLVLWGHRVVLVMHTFPCKSSILPQELRLLAGPHGEQAPELLKSPLQFLEAAQQRYGDLVSLVLGGERVVLVSGPEATRQVVVEDAEIWIKDGTAFFPGSALAGNGLLVSDGEVWRRQRRLSSPAFRQTAVSSFLCLKR